MHRLKSQAHVSHPKSKQLMQCPSQAPGVVDDVPWQAWRTGGVELGAFRYGLPKPYLNPKSM